VKVFYVYCHPLPESFHAAIRDEALAGLAEARHEVDLCDLYAEGFDPVMSAEERRRYHDTSRNQIGIESHVARLRAAEALVVQFPTWCFGPPAMLKGFLDKVLAPGVSFDLSDPKNVRPLLGNLKLVAGIVTYGRDRLRAFAMGDPPRKLVTRYLPRSAVVKARAYYHALYHMNVATEARRKGFMAEVRQAMARLQA
jgi:putative NADPH-quinone reductase